MMTIVKKAALAASLSLAIGGSLLGGATEALAEATVLGMPKRTCVTINCQATSFSGRIGAFGANANSSVIQFALDPGWCARFDVSAGFADLETIVVGPGGNVFRDDDGGLGNNPLVVISSANLTQGVHTVVIQHWAGTAVSGGYTLKAAQYDAANPNCAGPVTPLSATKSLNVSRTPSVVTTPNNGPQAD